MVGVSVVGMAVGWRVMVGVSVIVGKAVGRAVLVATGAGLDWSVLVGVRGTGVGEGPSVGVGVIVGV
jgi:hypothetical protein